MRQRLSYSERVRGHLGASEAHTAAAVALSERHGDRALLALALGSLGHTRLLLGADGIATLRRAVAVELELPELLGQQSPSWPSGSRCSSPTRTLGDGAAAAAWLGPASDELLAQGVVEHALYGGIVSNEVEALLLVGDQHDRAALLVDELERLARRTERPWAQAMAGRSRAQLLAADGDVDAARAALAVALDAHAHVPQPFELARTLALSGALERRAKQRGAARTALEQALAIFMALPAPRWAERTRAELARLGATRGAGELSATEARIAALAADGLSNPEIAATMFVSRTTVEANLTTIYRKLGVRSRVELARRAAASGDLPD